MRRALTLAATLALAAAAPTGFRKLASSDARAQLKLQIAVKRSHAGVTALESALTRVADPESRTFGAHLSLEEVRALTAPEPKSVAAVKNWLHQEGVRDVTWTPNSDYVTAMVSVRDAERLLGTQYHKYEAEADASFTLNRCEAYQLPEEVAAHVDFVAPTTNFPTIRKTRVRAADVRTGTTVTPSVIRQMYGVGNMVGSQPSNTQQAAGFLGQYAGLDDLASFFLSYYPAGVGSVLRVVGPSNSAQPGIEANLDVQYIMSVGGGVSTTFWYTNGTRPYDNEPFLEWMLNVSSLSNAQLPNVISVSYGDNEDTVDYRFASRVNQEFIALGARGVSLMFSSGDGGVSGSQSGPCPNGFHPTFPSASPYVTAVGATDVPSAEKAASFSGGGFSNYWARPSYQVNAVSQYFKVAQNLPSSSLYNATGAGFPDVAAIGTNFAIYYNGANILVDGTSCSAPTFSGMISLINDRRIAVGKSSLGYLNILLYKNPSLFYDITTGNNPGCNTNGFYAAAGWDPLTGLGSLNFQAALSYAMSLP